MNTTKVNVKTHNLLIAIKDDYQYTLDDQFGNTILKVSYDITPGLSLEQLEFEFKFVEMVIKTERIPFEFTKSMMGTTLKRTNKLGSIFYELLKFPKGISPPKYEPSEYSKVISAAWFQLNLDRVYFTGNPLSILNHDGLREGELINSFIILLRESIKSVAFRRKVKERKDYSTQTFNKSKRYVERLLSNNPGLFAMRFDLTHEDETSIEKSTRQMCKLTDTFEWNSNLGFPVGWWWKREFLSEIGYRIHLIVFFNVHNTLCDQALALTVAEHWQSIANGRCTCLNLSDYAANHKTWGAGYLQHPYQGNLEALLYSVKLMLGRDEFLRIEQDKKYPHWVMGELPKLIKVTNPLSQISDGI